MYTSYATIFARAHTAIDKSYDYSAQFLIDSYMDPTLTLTGPDPTRPDP